MKTLTPPHADVEYYYLLELTRRNIKPMSRRERPVTEGQIAFLRSHGLTVAQVPRITLQGHILTETVFGKRRYVHKYEKAFTGASLALSPEAQQLEGFLFGYPSCCVEQYIDKPYAPNLLSPGDQEILFHWACPDCRVTPELLPYYRSIHEEVWDWYAATFPMPQRAERFFPFKTAAAAVLLAGLLGVSSVSAENNHQLPVPGDTDGDGLLIAEEVALGSYYGDQDAVYWSTFFASYIDSIPRRFPDETPFPTDSTYRIDYLTCGEYGCPVCGEGINMGYMELINPRRDLTYRMSYMAHHFLANGSFSSFIDDQSDTTRIDISELKRILFPYDSDHMLPVAGDTDSDGIPDSLESFFHFSSGAWDSDGIGIPDGAKLAERLTALFPKLREHNDSLYTQVTVHPVRGVEECSVCGATVNMGYVELSNPENGFHLEVPLVNLHALAHGSFKADSDVHPESMVQPDSLFRTMNTHHIFIENDRDSDGLTDESEEEFGFDPAMQDTDQDGISDAQALANRMVERIEELPTEEQTDQPYVLHYHADGVYNCLVCGEMIDMGHMEIYNPLINTSEPLRISYHLYHYMQHGSFAMMRRTYEGWDEEQVDPAILAEYIKLLSSPDDEPGALPDEVMLYQNYPNPFNASTLIQFTLPEAMPVSLAIYDSRGQMVRQLSGDSGKAGLNTIRWDGKNDKEEEVSSGIYLYRLDSGDSYYMKKLTLIR